MDADMNLLPVYVSISNLKTHCPIASAFEFIHKL